LLGGIGSLVKGKTVTIKINLTGTNFTPFLDRPVGETFMTHEATAGGLLRPCSKPARNESCSLNRRRAALRSRAHWNWPDGM